MSGSTPINSVELFIRAQEEHNKNRCCVLRKQRENAVDCCIDYYTEKCCQGLDLNKNNNESSVPQSVLDKVKNYILDVDLNIDFGNRKQSSRENREEEIAHQDDFQENDGHFEEDQNDFEQEQNQFDDLENEHFDQNDFNESNVDFDNQDDFNTVEEDLSIDENNFSPLEGSTPEEVIQNLNDDNSTDIDLDNTQTNEFFIEQAENEDSFEENEENFDLGNEDFEGEEFNENEENEHFSEDFQDEEFPMEEFTESAEVFEDSFEPDFDENNQEFDDQMSEPDDNNFIQNENLRENKLENSNNMKNEQISTNDFSSDSDELFDDNSQDDIIDSMSGEDNLDPSSAVSASTFEIRKQNKNLIKKNQLKLEPNGNENDFFFSQNEEEGNVVDLENDSRKAVSKNKKRRVGVSLDNTENILERNTSIDMDESSEGASGLGGKGGRGGQVFSFEDINNSLDENQALLKNRRPNPRNFFGLTNFQNLLNEHKSISENFMLNQDMRNSQRKRNQRKGGIEDEIRNRFINSSNDFDVNIEDDETQENKTVRYNMTAVNRRS